MPDKPYPWTRKIDTPIEWPEVEIACDGPDGAGKVDYRAKIINRTSREDSFGLHFKYFPPLDQTRKNHPHENKHKATKRLKPGDMEVFLFSLADDEGMCLEGISSSNGKDHPIEFTIAQKQPKEISRQFSLASKIFTGATLLFVIGGGLFWSAHRTGKGATLNRTATIDSQQQKTNQLIYQVAPKKLYDLLTSDEVNKHLTPEKHVHNIRSYRRTINILPAAEKNAPRFSINIASVTPPHVAYTHKEVRNTLKKLNPASTKGYLIKCFNGNEDNNYDRNLGSAHFLVVDATFSNGEIKRLIFIDSPDAEQAFNWKEGTPRRTSLKLAENEIAFTKLYQDLMNDQGPAGHVRGVVSITPISKGEKQRKTFFDTAPVSLYAYLHGQKIKRFTDPNDKGPSKSLEPGFTLSRSHNEIWSHFHLLLEKNVSIEELKKSNKDINAALSDPDVAKNTRCFRLTLSNGRLEMKNAKDKLGYVECILLKTDPFNGKPSEQKIYVFSSPEEGKPPSEFLYAPDQATFQKLYLRNLNYQKNLSINQTNPDMEMFSRFYHQRANNKHALASRHQKPSRTNGLSPAFAYARSVKTGFGRT